MGDGSDRFVVGVHATAGSYQGAWCGGHWRKRVVSAVRHGVKRQRRVVGSVQYGVCSTRSQQVGRGHTVGVQSFL